MFELVLGISNVIQNELSVNFKNFRLCHIIEHVTLGSFIAADAYLKLIYAI
jgi:hypothetical protein